MKGGYTDYGQDVTILMLDTRSPWPPGDIGNARSYDFPVRYKTVCGAVRGGISGYEPDAAFPRVYSGNALELDADVLAAELVEMTGAFMDECSDAAAIPLERTNMCPLSPHVREDSGFPIFDINAMTNRFRRGNNPARYVG